MHLLSNNPLPYTLTATLVIILLLSLAVMQYPSPGIYIALLATFALTAVIGFVVCVRTTRTDPDGVLSQRTGLHVLVLTMDVLILFGLTYYVVAGSLLFP